MLDAVAPALHRVRRALRQRTCHLALLRELRGRNVPGVAAIVLDPDGRITACDGDEGLQEVLSAKASGNDGMGLLRQEVVDADLPSGYRMMLLTRPSTSGTPLTARETAILRLVAEGLTADAIAHRLGGSPRTVHKHLEHIFRKLEVRDRASAVAVAIGSGLLPGHRLTGPRPGARPDRAPVVG